MNFTIILFELLETVGNYVANMSSCFGKQIKAVTVR